MEIIKGTIDPWKLFFAMFCFLCDQRIPLKEQQNIFETHFMSCHISEHWFWPGVPYIIKRRWCYWDIAIVSAITNSLSIICYLIKWDIHSYHVSTIKCLFYSQRNQQEKCNRWYWYIFLQIHFEAPILASGENKETYIEGESECDWP